MYRRILLPLDGSPLAEQALPHSAVLAERFQAELILLKALVPLASTLNLPPGAVKKAEEVTMLLALEYLERVAARVQERNILVKTSLVMGQSHAGIIHFAEVNCIDVIVMSTCDHSWFSRLFLNSIADRVVRGTNIPVLLIRAEKDVHSSESISEEEPLPALQRVCTLR